VFYEISLYNENLAFRTVSLSKSPKNIEVLANDISMFAKYLLKLK
jgi:tRNA1(Val) A37 N6-methylase TrmN6